MMGSGVRVPPSALHRSLAFAGLLLFWTEVEHGQLTRNRIVGGERPGARDRRRGRAHVPTRPAEHSSHTARALRSAATTMLNASASTWPPRGASSRSNA